MFTENVMSPDFLIQIHPSSYFLFSPAGSSAIELTGYPPNTLFSKNEYHVYLFAIAM